MVIDVLCLNTYNDYDSLHTQNEFESVSLHYQIFLYSYDIISINVINFTISNIVSWN